MSKKTKKVTDSFWLSYSDLLTSLFFIMLVLFVICLVRMKISQGNLVGKIASWFFKTVIPSICSWIKQMFNRLTNREVTA